MARPVRIEYPGAYYYLTSKALEGELLFKGVKDRQDFLSILQEVICRMQWEVYAYNLMPDSFQLFIKTTKPNLSKGMRQVNGIYTQRYNARYERFGNIFHGRFKAVLVEADHSFKDVIRHVMQVPVQKRKTRNIDKWRWSSYQATTGLLDAPDWLKTMDVLNYFGKHRKRAQKALVKSINNYDKNFDLMKNVQAQILLGSDKFVNKWKKQLASGKIMDKARHRKEKKLKPLADFSKRFKDARTAIVKAYGTGNYTLEQVGTHFGVHYSTVSRMVKRAGF